MSKLEELKKESIVSFKLIDNQARMEIAEWCDNNFQVIYSKRDMQQLVSELQALTDKMD